MGIAYMYVPSCSFLSTQLIITPAKVHFWEDGLESGEGGRDTATSAEENEYQRVSETAEDYPVPTLHLRILSLFGITYQTEEVHQEQENKERCG